MFVILQNTFQRLHIIHIDKFCRDEQHMPGTARLADADSTLQHTSPGMRTPMQSISIAEASAVFSAARFLQ